MIGPKKLIKLAKKWQKAAAKGRKRISFPRTDGEVKVEVADTGHFVVYSSDKKRFMVPLAYINSSIFRGPFKMAEEEYGNSSGGPIVMPCDSIFMEYTLSLVRKGISEGIERALLNSTTTSWCSVLASPSQEPKSLQLAVQAH